MQWSKDNGVPVGPGPSLRRWLAGVAYALKITDLRSAGSRPAVQTHPNRDAVSMPDFNVDF
ncbi:hypothetical protein ACNKHS_01200 [Shigella flexneri]